jgi:glutathione S-transferase
MIEESINGNFATALTLCGRNLKAQPGEPGLQPMQQCRQSYRVAHEWPDGTLEGRRFFAGDEFPVADIAAICNVESQIKRLTLEIDPKSHNSAGLVRARYRPAFN